MRMHIVILFMPAVLQAWAMASCPLDHFLIGCNPDGLVGTEDDAELFLDVTQKYRHSDPNRSSSDTWLHWYYPMYFSSRYNRYQIGEPGFDILQDGSSRQLVGQVQVDYRLIVECVSISDGLMARELDPSFPINLSKPGDSFCHSCAGDSHIHIQYRVPAAADANEPYWITFRVYDQMGVYEPSDDVTLVFFNPPIEGDLVMNNRVDLADAVAFFEKWLAFSDSNLFTAEGKAALDLFERADINRDYRVDMADFAVLGDRWLLNGLNNN